MIKLRELLNVTEQAPQPPQTAPVPAQSSPTSAATPQEPIPAPTPDTAPTPEDPSEYDFTRDFRAFEDTKNKAEAAAKKKLLDKMNKVMLGKKVIANASRGYGQPKTDYTIESVKKVSVEFWYKDWVVIVSDENDKKFFLTPGINIKIETGGAAVEPGAETTPDGPQADQAPTEPPKVPEPPAPEPEIPAKPKVPTATATGITPPPSEPKAEPEVPTTATGTTTDPTSPEQPLVRPAPLKKKKKAVIPATPVAEDLGGNEEENVGKVLLDKNNAQEDLGRLFAEFTKNNRFDVRPFVTRARSSGRDADGMYNNQYRLRIPVNVLGNDFNPKEFELFVKTEERRYGGPGEPFSNGYVNIQPVGKTYIFNFELSGGLDI